MMDEKPNASVTQDELVLRLVRHAGYREAPPDASYEQVFAAAEAAWQTKLARRRVRRNRVYALAASLLLVVAGGLWLALQTLDPGDAALGRVTRLAGTLEFYRAGEDAWLPVTTETGINLSLVPDQRFRTGPGSGVALDLDGGVSLRVAANTIFELRTARQLRLLDGRVYVDTGPGAAAARHFEVVTPSGSVTDIGTQFEVAHSRAFYRVRVREGRVEFAADSRTVQGHRGEQLSLQLTGPADAPITREPISTAGNSWDWVEALAAPPAIDGRPLTVALDWVARETGRRLMFADDAVAQRANRIIMRGSITGLAPLAALDTVLAATDLEARLTDDGTILISSRN